MITVHGLLGEPGFDLRIQAAAADWVVGGRRHLDALEVEDERRITLGALRPAVERIATLPATDQIIVIASGDPLYFGVVRALRRLGLRPEVVSAPSSIASAFAAVGVPWDDAVVVSVHGRPLAAAVNLALANPKVAVFTSAENGIRQLAAGLAGLDRWFVLAERLGEHDARVRVLDSAAALAVEPLEPNVVLILDRPVDADDTDWAGALAGPVRGTRPEVSSAAAVAFARLLPEPGELLWASGPLAAEVAALARWSGAAVLDPIANPRTPADPVASAPTAAGRAGFDKLNQRALSLAEPVETTTPTPAEPVETTSSTPDLVLANSLSALGNRRPRAIVLTGEPPADLPAGYRWTSESIGDHQLTTGVLE